MRPAWYLKISDRVNRDWTRKERNNILTMRNKKGLSIKEISDIMDVTPNQINNCLRIMRKSLEGRCYTCGRKLTESDKKLEVPQRSKKDFFLCKKCKEEKSEYKKKRRKDFKTLGKCAACGKYKPLKNRVSCSKCVSSAHRRRYKEGLCGRCGVRPLAHNSKAFCNICLKRNRVHA